MYSLKDVKTYFICPDHNEKYQRRRAHMEELLTSIGFTNFHHYKSGSYQYPACLADAICDILGQNLDEPVLILEDDVDTTGQLNFEMPAGCDAVFFGLSRCAGSRTINRGDGLSRFTPFSESQVRVHNMLSQHAVLFVSRAIKERYITTVRKYAGTPYHSDVLFSRIQSEFLVLANRMPAFWQSNAYNEENLETYTKIYIDGPPGVYVKPLV